MKIISGVSSAIMLSLFLAVITGCDWQGGDGFNTSGGVDINFSGVYRGRTNGAPVVANQNITRLVITQTGNTIQVWDDHNSYYEGTVGTPAVASQPSGSSYPSGAQLVQAQISFSGVEKTSGVEIQFVGIMHAIAVEDIQGNRTDTAHVTGTETNVADNSTLVLPLGQTDTEILSYNDSASVDQSVISFQITEANVQYVLQGNWMSSYTTANYVDAISEGTYGIITVPVQGTVDVSPITPEITLDGTTP